MPKLMNLSIVALAVVATVSIGGIDAQARTCVNKAASGTNTTQDGAKFQAWGSRAASDRLGLLGELHGLGGQDRYSAGLCREQSRHALRQGRPGLRMRHAGDAVQVN